MRASADWRAWGCAVRLVVTDPAALPVARDVLARWLDEVDRACSRFRPDSELVGLAERSAGRPVPVSPVLAEALHHALRAARATDGRVDPTVGTALDALGYDRDFTLVQQDGRPLRLDVRPAPGWRRVGLDLRRHTVSVPEGVALDLGATAKAWAADRAAQALAVRLGCGVLVALGGDTAVAGAVPEDGWRIRVQDRTDAADPDAPHAVVAIRSGGLATSGTEARNWTRGGHRLHHLVDPSTGRPVDGPWRTVSVAAASCADANTAATAAFVLGPDAPAWLAERQLPARLVSVDGTVTPVAGWPADAEEQRSAA